MRGVRIQDGQPCMEIVHEEARHKARALRAPRANSLGLPDARGKCFDFPESQSLVKLDRRRIRCRNRE
jgi:hypothetical protein